MKKILNILLSSGLTGFYFDDLAAISNGAKKMVFYIKGNLKQRALLQ